MHITPVVLAGVFARLPSLATAGAGCCDKDKGCEMKECAMHDGDRIASGVLLPQDVINAAPVRQSLVALFQRPTKVGDRICSDATSSSTTTTAWRAGRRARTSTAPRIRVGPWWHFIART